jgi:hypothetical protein
MSNASTNRDGNKIPRIALAILRGEPGSFKRVRRRLGVSKSHVSMVATGKRRSMRVRFALIREAIRLAKIQGYRTAIELEEHTRR